MALLLAMPAAAGACMCCLLDMPTASCQDGVRVLHMVTAARTLSKHCRG